MILDDFEIFTVGEDRFITRYLHEKVNDRSVCTRLGEDIRRRG